MNQRTEATARDGELDAACARGLPLDALVAAEHTRDPECAWRTLDALARKHPQRADLRFFTVALLDVSDSAQRRCGLLLLPHLTAE